MRKNKESLKVLGFVLSSLFMYKLCQGANIEKLVQKCDPKVVKVGVIVEEELAPGLTIVRHGVGSGAFIDSKGTVLTCAHVINHKGLRKLFVKISDGTVYLAEVTKVDADKDLALLELTAKDGIITVNVSDGTIVTDLGRFPYFRFGKPVHIGQQVVLFGSPLDIQGSVSVGWVENLVNGIFGISHLVVLHNAPTNPGNSGGPLVNLRGQLVGVGEGELMMNPFVPAQGLGFAIDIEEVQKFLQEK